MKHDWESILRTPEELGINDCYYESGRFVDCWRCQNCGMGIVDANHSWPEFEAQYPCDEYILNAVHES